MYDQSPMQSQHTQSFGQFLDEIQRIHSHHLPGSASWISEWTEQIEHGSHAQVAAHCLYLLHGGMKIRRVQEANSYLTQALRRTLRRKLNVYAKSFNHIGRAAFGADAAIAVLSHAHARSCRDESCRRGNVERTAGVAAGSADRKELCTANGQGRRRRANRLREAHNFLDRFPFHAQCDQQRRDLRIRTFAAQHLAHHPASFPTVERLAVVSQTMKGVENHVGSAAWPIA